MTSSGRLGTIHFGARPVLQMVVALLLAISGLLAVTTGGVAVGGDRAAPNRQATYPYDAFRVAFESAAKAPAIPVHTYDAPATFPGSSTRRPPGLLAAEETTIAARSVNFTQNSVKATFSDGRSLFDESLNPATAPPIRVFEENGQLYSLDNRRLFVGQLQDANVPVRYATPEEYNAAVRYDRFTSTNGGIGITVRGGNGYFQFPSISLWDVAAGQ